MFIIKKKIIILTTLVITIIVLVRLYFFTHSTPERAIRANLFLNAHIVKAFTTEVYKSGVDNQYGQIYSCRDPQVGESFYAWKKGSSGLWFVSIAGEG